MSIDMANEDNVNASATNFTVLGSGLGNKAIMTNPARGRKIMVVK